MFVSQPPGEEVFNECVVNPYDFKRNDRGKLAFEWEGHGLKLELPGERTAFFNLKTVSSNGYKLPKKAKQLSPVYWVETEDNLGGPVGVELQHYVRGSLDDQRRGLRFAVSKVNRKKSSYKFELRKGLFNDNSYGRLEMEHFSAWRVGIVQVDSSVRLSPKFLANLYYQKVSQSVYIINLVVVPCQEAYEKVSKTNMLIRHIASSYYSLLHSY